MKAQTPFSSLRASRATPIGQLIARWRGKSGVAARGADASPLIALSDGLQFANVFVSESKQAVVHLAQPIHENRNVDVQIFILVFAWLEPAMKKRVLYTVYQIWDNALQPEREPLLALLRKSKTEWENLSKSCKLSLLQDIRQQNGF